MKPEQVLHFNEDQLFNPKSYSKNAAGEHDAAMLKLMRDLVALMEKLKQKL